MFLIETGSLRALWFIRTRQRIHHSCSNLVQSIHHITISGSRTNKVCENWFWSFWGAPQFLSIAWFYPSRHYYYCNRKERRQMLLLMTILLISNFY